MQPNEFTAWLDGFLDGKESLTAEQIATLRTKADKLTPFKGLNVGILPRAVTSDPHAYAGKAL